MPVFCLFAVRSCGLPFFPFWFDAAAGHGACPFFIAGAETAVLGVSSLFRFLRFPFRPGHCFSVYYVYDK